MGGGEPMDDLYASWQPDSARALGAVERAIELTPDQTPETVSELSDSTLRGLGLSPGQVGHVVTQS